VTDGRDGLRDDQPIYLYCVIRSEEEWPFSAKPLKTRGIGENGSAVHTVRFEDLAFVVSDCDDVKYDATRENTVCHQKVIEEVMDRGFNLLPVRFGTIATASRVSTTEERIRKVLKRRFGEFQGLLRDMEDKVEVGLKVFWKKARFFDDVVSEYRQVRMLRDRIASRPSSGLAWRDERIQLGTMVNNAIEDKREREAPRLIRPLHPIAYDYKTNKIMTDTMVLNGAFLIYKERLGEFDAAVNELDERYGDRMKFNYVGCLPPFNFIEIVIRWDEEEEWAPPGRSSATWLNKKSDRLQSSSSSFASTAGERA
jgi:hypothetical protein